MRRNRWIPTLLTLTAGTACAIAPTGNQPVQPRTTAAASVTKLSTDDSDIAPPSRDRGRVAIKLEQEGERVAGGLQFPLVAQRPMRILPTSRQVTVKGVLHAFDAKGAEIPLARVTVSAGRDGQGEGASTLTDAQGRFELTTTGSGDLVFALANNHWSLRGKSGSYTWTHPVSGSGSVDLGVLTPVKGSANAQAAIIHALFVHAENQLQRYGVGLEWWSKSIPTTWPGDADYYNWGGLNLTDATHWDVNGHELGHALSDQAFNMRFGGGQHYIDRCYNPTIAWSEGVASFISGIVSIDPSDPDAKFEFMVPRRAPIRLENVPADVCEGPTNEWRAAAAIWDLWDTHEDGNDKVSIDLPTLWRAWKKGNGAPAIGSVVDAYELVAKAAPAQREALKQAMAQNTMPVSLFAGRR